MIEKIKKYYTKPIFWLVLILTLVFLVIGFLAWELTSSLVERNFRNDIDRVMAITLAAVSPDRIARQALDPTNESTADYKRLREQMLRLGEVFKDYGIESAYVMSQTDKGNILFLVDTLPESDPNYGPAGEPYKEPPKELLETFADGQTRQTGIYTDEYGTYISLFSPIKTFSDNKQIGIVGVDVNYGNFRQRFLSELVMIYIVILLIYIALIFALISLFRRREYLANLRLSEGRFRSVFDNVKAGILVADPETKKFILTNHQMSELLGYSEKELLNLTVKDIHPAKNLSFVLKQFEKQAKGELKIAEALPVLRKDKKIIFCDVRTSNYDIGPKKYLLGVFNDVTEKKTKEEELQKRTEEAERFNRLTVGRELKMIELKNELTALKNKKI